MTREAVKTATIFEWPDFVGEPIDPEKFGWATVGAPARGPMREFGWKVAAYLG